MANYRYSFNGNDKNVPDLKKYGKYIPAVLLVVFVLVLSLTCFYTVDDKEQDREGAFYFNPQIIQSQDLKALHDILYVKDHSSQNPSNQTTHPVTGKKHSNM